MFSRAIPLILLILCIIPYFTESRVHNKTINKINSDEACVYTLYVQTGLKVAAGTDSKINLTLTGDDGNGVSIHNLEAWGGLMGSDHDYFEAGNLDIFSGRAPCLSTTPCQLNLTTDGTGVFPAWYCDYVEVTTTRPGGHCAKTNFSVEQWLNVFTFYTANIDYCSKTEDGNSWPAAPLLLPA
ncbi:PLAT/LH2 domain-containing protein [Dioscorea alata]|uniref:PLAT/LH2 domain-containing protein n=1 Tax=Dioscorea alata TaxID=55571 RepID=A0ACB7W8D8_DIOAL|nr:PLAT/LH2 domain-containing protein [Dioscorea alata]